MRILLIRHGESIDNVAGLYAGSRDSPLTNHGVLQIKRLGAHLAKRCNVTGPIKYIFTSTLQRAYQTAEAIAEALNNTNYSTSSDASESQVSLEVFRLPELREKDYGSSEGKRFGVKAGRTAETPIQSDSETHQSMRTRVDVFLNTRLVPIVNTYASDNITVAVVAHGIILGVLLRALLEQFPSKSPSASRGESQEGLPEFAAWSNTGVLQAKLEAIDDNPASGEVALAGATLSKCDMDSTANPPKKRLRLIIEFSNSIEHLQGLKKTRGGIGSAKFDSRQRTMDSFFGSASKKRKLEDADNS